MTTPVHLHPRPRGGFAPCLLLALPRAGAQSLLPRHDLEAPAGRLRASTAYRLTVVAAGGRSSFATAS